MIAGGESPRGKTTEGAAYCRGYNAYGQLGDGTIENTFEPQAVAARDYSLEAAGRRRSPADCGC